MAKMTAPIGRAMEEARRRFESFAMRDGKSLESAWLGLGFPSEYRAAVQAGLMRPLHGQERPRVLTWYLLTESGVALYREAFPGSESGESVKYRNGSLIGESV